MKTENETIKEVKEQLKEAYIDGGKFIAEAILLKLMYLEVDMSRNKHKDAYKRVIQLIKEVSNVK